MTAEFALVLPAVVVVLGLVLATVAWAGHHLRAGDLASLAARTAAVEGDSAAQAAVAGADARASLALSRSGTWVTATVSVEAASWLPTARNQVTARVEP
ncbi:hypothetical protein [Demequina globuliformis]|uniref:hypothetical protein n=1 Tax=Demequina globuliformis TaxID=676202 RepID=UPI000782139E|nr:hypothetical protein [Demequina globuliformis]